MRAYLDGKKTYILSVAGMISAVAAWITGELNFVQAVEAFLLAASVGTLRAGVSKS